MSRATENPRTEVIMPVLGMSQDSGRLLRWLKAPGEHVEKGEPLMEVETDKAVAEIEAPATGILAEVCYDEGADVPVTKVMAVIVGGTAAVSVAAPAAPVVVVPAPAAVSPLAARMATEHHLDLAQIRPRAGRIEKADVLAYIEAAKAPVSPAVTNGGAKLPAGRVLASPKARRLAEERGLDIRLLRGSGPDGAVLAEDVLAAQAASAAPTTFAAPMALPPQPDDLSYAAAATPHEIELPVSPVWARMVERLSAAWPQTPHFYLAVEVDATRLIAWRELAQQAAPVKITYTDLLVKLAALALRKHPRLNVHFRDGGLFQASDVNVALAIATADDLVDPVIHRADTLGLAEIAARRADLAARGRDKKLRLEDLQGGVFTISNLGMYGIDAFSAMVNPGQAAILAVGRIADRVVPVNGQPAIRPMLTLTASFDHRAVDGARGAEFLQTLAAWISEPLSMLI